MTDRNWRYATGYTDALDSVQEERKAASAMLAALKANVIALENYAGRLQRVHMLMTREMVIDIQRGRTAIAQAEAAGIKAEEAPANTLPASSRLAQGDAP